MMLLDFLQIYDFFQRMYYILTWILNEVVTPIAAESAQRVSVSVPFLCFHTENGPWLIGTK